MSIEQPQSEPPLRTHIHVPTTTALQEILDQAAMHECDVIGLFRQIESGHVMLCEANRSIMGVQHIALLPNGTQQVLLTNDLDAADIIGTQWPQSAISAVERSNDNMHGLPITRYTYALAPIPSAPVTAQVVAQQVSFVTRVSALLFGQRALHPN